MPNDGGARRPNILILMADQLTPGILPAYGNGWVKTPVLDRMAAEGVVFDAAYCNSPLCAPSRATFMTGQLPSRHGVYDNAAELAAHTPTFAHHLRALGYRTILTGKMHFCGADQLHGFEERLTTDIYPADFGWTPDWSRPDERPSWYHNMRSVIDAGPCIRTNQLDFDEEVVHTAERRLFDLARDRDRRPFLMVASLTHPHDPFAIPRRWWDLYEDSAIGMARVGRDEVADDPHSARLRFVCETDRDPPSGAQAQAARRAYSGAVSYVDAQFGRVLGALDEAGFADDTVTILLSDHGEMLGERGLWYKMSFFEGSCRIPLVVHAPGRFAPRRSAEPVSLVDLLPTIAELTGASLDDMPQPVAGTSLVALCEGLDESRTVVGEYMAEGSVAPIVMIRRGSLKFVHCPVDPDQLYDLSLDPNELVNLAGDPRHADTVASMRAEVASRWDLTELTAQVLADQARRRYVTEALRSGHFTAWDYTPPVDGSTQYMRNHLDLNDVERRARWPR